MIDLEDYFHFAQIFLLYILLLSAPHLLIPWFIHSLIHSSCQHLLNTYYVLDSGLSTTIRAVMWVHSDGLTLLFNSFSISPTQTSTVSELLASTPHPYCPSCCCWPPPAPQHPLLPHATPCKFLILFLPLHFHNTAWCNHQKSPSLGHLPSKLFIIMHSYP